jgi:hypothetical protein
MTRRAPIGTAEQAVLVALSDRGGVWAAGDRPLWESNHWTLKLLNTLTGKGLVQELEYNQRYGFTDQGRVTATEILSKRASISQDWDVDCPRQRGSYTAGTNGFPRR